MPETAPGIAYACGSSFDEMVDANNRVRPHWRAFVQHFGAAGGSHMEKSRTYARRILRENGISYNVHGDPAGAQRTWELDPVPLILSSGDWDEIEAGLLQRAELMKLILMDLYGQRRLILRGLLPPELVFGHQGFLRACDRYRPQHGIHLADVAVDLARGPDGRMWVLRDYTQSPSGIGYALENRTVMTRILPEFFREGDVHRLSLFFRSLRVGLNGLTGSEGEQPRIVVLTPGPFNELYFEHAYLASYLGYPLVQGDDLTVREERVWLKTLSGLQPVDVIIRRLNDLFCDPLELAEDSLLGVAGLMQAARKGNVVVVNPIGSGVLENPGLIPFLPAISRYFLGAELRLPSAATWWCGQEKELRYVLDHLDCLVIKPIHRRYDAQAVFGSLLNRSQLEDLRKTILSQPDQYVGQEQVSFSTSPCLVSGKLEPRHAVIRTFMTAHDGSYQVMKGGLTRAARDAGMTVPSRYFEYISKDTWVIASRPDRHISLWLPPVREEAGVERSGILASTAAESLFWAGRYAERTEGAARLLRVVIRHINRAEDTSDESYQAHIRLMQQALTSSTETYPGFLGEKVLSSEEALAELLSIMTDAERAGGIPQLLTLLTSAAYMVRDRWSADNWRVLDGIKNHWRNVQSVPHRHIVSAEYELDELITSLAAFMGLNMESMTREPGWTMLDCGRRIERGLWLARTTKAMLIPERDELLEQMVLETFLATHESLITHRRRYRSYMQMQTALEVVLLDKTNPRALAYQVERLQRDLGRLPNSNQSKQVELAEQIATEASARINMTNERMLSRIEKGFGYSSLLDFIAYEEERLMAISEAIIHQYFSHAEGVRQLVPTRQQAEP